MAAESDPTQSTCERDVELPKRVTDRLVTRTDGLAPLVERALRPFRVRIGPSAEGARLSGDDLAVGVAEQMLSRLAEMTAESGRVDDAVARAAFDTAIDHALSRELAFRLDGIVRPLRPMSFGQVAFLNVIIRSDKPLVIGVGPTGTGKTHLAVAAGLSLLARERVKHVIISRPHVLLEGEAMTATLREEVTYDDQFLPIEDVLHDLIGADETRHLQESGKLKLMPLGQMRGRTFNDSYVVIDEAQNLTVRLMRMAAGRIGRSSRLVVTGDPEQVHLRTDEDSGLSHLVNLVRAADFAAIYEFERREIIRNDFVAELEELYARDAGGESSVRVAA